MPLPAPGNRRPCSVMSRARQRGAGCWHPSFTQGARDAAKGAAPEGRGLGSALSFLRSRSGCRCRSFVHSIPMIPPTSFLRSRSGCRCRRDPPRGTAGCEQGAAPVVIGALVGGGACSEFTVAGCGEPLSYAGNSGAQWRICQRAPLAAARSGDRRQSAGPRRRRCGHSAQCQCPFLAQSSRHPQPGYCPALISRQAAPMRSHAARQ